MSVQDPEEQFEHEQMEDELEESQDSSVASPLSEADAYARSNESESIGVPADEAPVLSPEDSAAEEEDESERPTVPAIEELPLSSSDELPPPEPTDGPAWYVIHCYSGYENKVRHNLEQRIETMGMKDKIFDVVIPTQEEIEVKDGKRRTVERHIFPGYVLVNMALTEESWYVVRNTPGVTGFVGMGNNPTPLRPEEVAQIVKRMEAEAPTVKVTFKVGERVRIVDGPFNDFRGVVSEIDMERTKVRVMVSFFGRETPVELDFLQVEKA
jgi:transcriptional antiterminator NusG